MKSSTNSNQEELKKRIESLLFVIGKRLTIERISKILQVKPVSAVKNALISLKQDYDKRDSALEIENIGNRWRMTPKTRFLEDVERIITATEFPKSLAETMAIIAWKAPVIQTELVEIRSNKAYDHIKELLEMGFITKKRSGRSYLIGLTRKFYEYFDVKDRDELKRKLDKNRKV